MMVWERIKRISEAELPPTADGATGVRLDREPPAHWADRFALARSLRGQELVFDAAPDNAGGTGAQLAQIDAQIHQANLRYEAEVLKPAVLEVMEALGADRSTQALSNPGTLLVENEATDISQPVDAALAAALIAAGSVDHTG